MKKLRLLVCMVLFSTPQTFAQGTPEERRDLHDLLEVRRKKFDAYSNSLGKRSGIFGNKTKKDVQHSTDVLVEIIETDNRIISSLNHVIDFRNYQKVNTNYDKYQCEERLSNLQRATDTLTTQVNHLSISNARLKSKVLRLNWLVYTASFLFALILVLRWRRKFITRG